MRLRYLFSLLICVFIVLSSSCSTRSLYSTWANQYRSLNARFHRVAVFTDFVSIRPAVKDTAVIIDDSLKLGHSVDAQVKASFELLDYDVGSSGKHFIGSYAVETMPVADSRNDEPAYTEAPFHIDPDVTHSKSYEKAVIEAFRAFAGMAAGGPETVETGALDERVARIMSSKYAADAVILVIGVSRKVPGEPDTDGTLNSSRVYRLRSSYLCIGVFHGFNGKLLWYGQEAYKDGQLDSAFKGTAKALLADFPPMGEGPYFASPFEK